MSKVEPSLVLGRGGIRHSDCVVGVSALANGTIIAADWSGEIRAWRSSDGADLGVLKSFGKQVRTMAVSADKKRMACSLSDKSIHVLELPGGREIAVLNDLESERPCLCFAAEGRGLYFADSRKNSCMVQHWDPVSGRDRIYLKMKTVASRLAASPDGKQLVACLGYGQMRWLDVKSGDLLAKFRIPGGWDAEDMAFSPDGKLLAVGCIDGSVRFYDAGTREQVRHVRSPKYPTGDSAHVHALVFSPDGRQLAVGRFGGRISILEVAGKKVQEFERRHYTWVSGVDYSADGRLLVSGGGDASLLIWDAASGKRLLSEDRHAGGICSLAFSPDGRTLATGSKDETVRLWDLASGESQASFAGQAYEPHPVALSPDGRVLATGGDDKSPLRLWDVSGRKQLASVAKGVAPGHMAFSPDGLWLAYDNEHYNNIRLLDMKTGRMDCRFVLQGRVKLLAWLGDSRRLGIVEEDHNANEGVFRVLDVRSESEVFRFSAGRWFGGGTISKDGKRLYGASEGKDGEPVILRAWNIADGSEAFRLPNRPGEPKIRFLCADCSEDGRLLVSAITYSREVAFWDLESRQMVLSLSVPSKVESLKLGPGARRLAVGLANSTGLVYDLTGPLAKFISQPRPVPERTPCVFLDEDKKPAPVTERNPAQVTAGTASKPVAPAANDVHPFTRVTFHMRKAKVEHNGIVKYPAWSPEDVSDAEAWLLPGAWLMLCFGDDGVLWQWNGWPEVHLRTKGPCLYLAPGADGPWTLLAAEVRTDKGRKVVREMKPPANLYGIVVSGTIDRFVGARIRDLGVQSITLLDFKPEVAAKAAGFGELRALATGFSGNRLDPTPLGDLVQFQAIYAYGGSVRVDGLRSLAGLKALESLTLMRYVGELGEDYTALAGLRNLRSLDLTDSERLKDLSFLAGNAELLHLNLRGCKAIKDYGAVAGLGSLAHLDLGYHQRLRDVGWIPGLRNLARLNLSGCDGLQDISSLAGLPNLLHLDLSGCGKIRDLNPIRKLPRLVKLEGVPGFELKSAMAVPAEAPRKAAAERPARAEEFLKTLAELGWFEPLPAGVREDIERRARESDSDSPSLGECLCSVWVDTESCDDEGAYESLLLELAEASHGVFEPQDISEKWNRKKEEIALSFKHEGKTFRRKLKYQGDWLDVEVFELVNEVLQASGTQLRFLPLPGEGQDISIALTTPKLFKKAQAIGLLAK